MATSIHPSCLLPLYTIPIVPLFKSSSFTCQVHNTQRFCHVHVVTYTYIHGNMHIIYADKSVSVWYREVYRKLAKTKEVALACQAVPNPPLAL